MKKSDLMVALAASLGVGAATFYTMSKSNQPLNTAMENITPMLNSIANTEDNGSSGQNSMMNQNSLPSNQSQNQNSNQKQEEQPFQTNMMN